MSLTANQVFAACTRNDCAAFKEFLSAAESALSVKDFFAVFDQYLQNDPAEFDIEIMDVLLEYQYLHGSHTIQSKCLYKACSSEHISVVDKLLGLPEISVNKRCYRSYAICNAVRNKKEEVVKLLLTRSDIELNVKCRNDYCGPLIQAVVDNSINIVQLLLDWKDAQGRPADILHDCFRDPQEDRHDIPREWLHMIPLAFVIQENNMTIFQMILARGDFDPNTPARETAGPPCQWQGKKPPARGTVFVEAIRKDRLEMARLLLQHPLFDMTTAVHNIDVDKEISSYRNRSYVVLPQTVWALHAAVRECNLEATKLILSLENVDVALPADKGNSVLHVACAEGTLEIIDYLLTFDNIRGLVNVRNATGDVPLYLCPTAEKRQTLRNADAYNVKNANASRKMRPSEGVDGSIGTSNEEKSKLDLTTIPSEMKALILCYFSPDEAVDLMCMCCKGEDLYFLFKFAMHDARMVNLKDSHGNTVIHRLSGYCIYNDMLVMLLSGKATEVALSGGRVSQYSREKVNVLRNAVVQKNVELVRYLSVNHKNAFKDTVNTGLLLKMCCSSSSDDQVLIMGILLSEFAENIDVNQANREGKGPLYDCICNGHVENINLLLTRDDVNPFQTPRDDFRSGPWFLYIIAHGIIKKILKEYIVKHHPEEAKGYF
jgi:hypothetical protein